jgi:RimJ/RimL family protein N-acetyltransferase
MDDPVRHSPLDTDGTPLIIRNAECRVEERCRSSQLDPVASESAGYPTEFGQSVVLRNGVRMRIRALRRCEQAPIRDLDSHVSVRSRYHRFLSPMHAMPDSLVRLLACVDDRRSLALVAEREGGDRSETLGLANCAAVDDGVAELGLLVRDDYQYQGIGIELASRIVRAAESRGLHRFLVWIASDNVAIRRILQRVGDAIRTTARGNVYEVAFVSRVNACSRTLSRSTDLPPSTELKRRVP